MEDDEQDGLDADEELTLPEEDELERRRKLKKKVALPERTGGSPLLRRVIVGEVKEKGVDADGETKRKRAGRRRPAREIGTPGQTDDVPEPGATAMAPAEGPIGEDGEDRSGVNHWREPPGTVVHEATAEAGGDGSNLAEVFPRAEPDVTGKAAPKSGRRRRKVQFDQESEWEGRGWPSSWWVGAGLLCVLLVAGAVYFVVGQGRETTGAPAAGGERRPQSPVSNVSGISYENLPISDFVARSAELLPELREVLIRSESGDGGAELLRGGEASLRRRDAWRERYPQPAPFREEGLHEIHASGTNRFAYIMMTGEREDYSYLEAYFVKEGDHMRLDWEATEGYSEVLPDEVEVLKDGKPRLMRAVVTLSNFYTDVYPEENYRCYTLHHDDPGEWLWAYADRAGEADVRLLTHMAGRDPLGRTRKVAVMITKQVAGSRANQVEIEEVLFGGWIAPPGLDGDETGAGVSPD